MHMLFYRDELSLWLSLKVTTHLNFLMFAELSTLVRARVVASSLKVYEFLNLVLGVCFGFFIFNMVYSVYTVRPVIRLK